MSSYFSKFAVCQNRSSRRRQITIHEKPGDYANFGASPIPADRIWEHVSKLASGDYVVAIKTWDILAVRAVIRELLSNSTLVIANLGPNLNYHSPTLIPAVTLVGRRSSHQIDFPTVSNHARADIHAR